VVDAVRRIVAKVDKPAGGRLLYVRVNTRLGGTEATGKMAVPEYVALAGSGKLSVVAPDVLAGVAELVALKAATAGSAGAMGAPTGATGTLVPVPEQPTRYNDNVAIVARAI
jgi:hypothetical protein